jgi:hypothetical protein
VAGGAYGLNVEMMLGRISLVVVVFVPPLSGTPDMPAI